MVAPKHAHAITVSLDRDMTDDELKTVTEVIKRSTNVRYVTGIAELDESGRRHGHWGVIMHPNRACTPGNFKHGTLLEARGIRDMLADLQTDSYAIKVKWCYSDGWIAHYMDKGGQEYIYSDMPHNMEEIAYAFTDIVVKKAANPIMEKYERMYTDDNRPMPADLVSCEAFFRYHWYAKKDLKIAEERKRHQLYEDLMRSVNCDDSLPEMNKNGKRVRLEPHRYCPRCPEDREMILEPRQQYCDNCKKY